MKSVLKYWNVWGGVLIATFIAFLKEFNKTSMDSTTSYIVMVLTIIGAMTFMRSKFQDKKQKTLEKVLSEQKSLKVMKLANNPEMEVQKIAEKIDKTIEIVSEDKTMKKIADFFKWLWGNKFTLLSLTLSIGAVAFCNFLCWWGYLERYYFFAQNETMCKVVIVIVTGVYLAADIFTTISKYGCESLAQLQARYAEEAERKLNALTPEQKKIVKQTLTSLKEELAKAKVGYEQAKKEIDSYTLLASLPGYDNSANNAKYVQAQVDESKYNNLMLALQKQIATLENRLK